MKNRQTESTSEGGKCQEENGSVDFAHSGRERLPEEATSEQRPGKSKGHGGSTEGCAGRRHRPALNDSVMRIIMRLETVGQRQVGVRRGSLPTLEALDALRPHDTGFGAAPPGQPLVRWAPRVRGGEKAPGDSRMWHRALPVGLAEPCETISFQLLMLIESELLQRDE